MRVKRKCLCRKPTSCAKSPAVACIEAGFKAIGERASRAEIGEFESDGQ
jgi:hypothetical protein